MSNENEIHEAKLIVKVNAKGEKKKKFKCKSGFKLGKDGRSCTPITGSEKANKKKALKKGLKTRKQGGEGAKRRSSKKRAKAMKKRKSYGL